MTSSPAMTSSDPPPHREAGAADPAAISRRDFLKSAGLAAVLPGAVVAGTNAVPAGDGTPEQIHLTFGNDPSRSAFVSWATPAQAVNPRVLLERPGGARQVVRAVQRTYTDGLNGQTVFTYHAGLEGLEPHSAYRYSVTADNDSRRHSPFTASLRTAPRGRFPFRWTSYGDLATPVTSWKLSSPQSRHAVDAVERFQPLFHLLNGDLCYANQNPTAQPAVWADFGNNVQRSAANRPWMPCPGNHEIEFGNGELGMNAYLTRYALPDNGSRFAGHWYSFRVGSALFISLAADDVIYQDSGAFHAGPGPLTPAPSTGHAPIEPGTSLYIHGFSGGERPAGWSRRWPRRTRTMASTGSSCRCTRTRSAPPARATARTRESARPGCRSSTATPSISCSAVTIMTTSAAGRCAAATTTSDATQPAARRSIPVSPGRS
ncbi:MAG: metallophosphoesterase family protein [Steroidobacteraceae bacterium]